MNNKLPPQEAMLKLPPGLVINESKVFEYAHEWRESTAQCLVKLEDFPLYADRDNDNE